MRESHDGTLGLLRGYCRSYQTLSLSDPATAGLIAPICLVSKKSQDWVCMPTFVRQLETVMMAPMMICGSAACGGDAMRSEKAVKSTAGGSAAERGLDFQARASAIVMAHLLAERPIGWLEGILDETPFELDAETGGPGDDIRFVTKGGKRVELQVKRGLQSGKDLWEALLALSVGISVGKIDAGVLAVCPDSSGTIRAKLAEDIVRLGTGRSDGLREIGRAWAEKLSGAALDASLVCRHLRIVVVSAVDGNREAEATAIERLSSVVHDPMSAWPVLVDTGRRLIRMRGRVTPEDICRYLSLAHVGLKTSDIDTRAQLLAATREWLHSTHASMTLIGINGAVPFNACWLELDAKVMDRELAEQDDLDKALRHYHEYGDRRHTGRSVDSPTIARFIKKCIVIGGPGIGKSTLLKKLALDYSADGFLTLLVRLPQVVALVTREGRRFEDSLLDVALSASGIRAPLASLEGAVVLCDALDECGNQQPIVTACLHAFAAAHPRARIVVTSRPIGYRPGELAGWRHYELQPLSDTQAEQAVLQVLQVISFAEESKRSQAMAFAQSQLRTQTIKGAASRSPLMITLLAALSAKGVAPGHSKAALYRQLFQLLEDHPPPRLAESPPSEPERGRFLEMLGWCLLCHGHETTDETLSRCAQWWSEETGQRRLASETKARVCLEYWECLGVVERVRTFTQEAITFVHKTFGEFAAGRYLSRSDSAKQREMVASAIRAAEWKETLSFASHFGLASLILEVWAEIAERGDSKAGYRLDDAVELVVQPGVSVSAEALAAFARCCWQAVENTASRVRYSAGEALCLLAKDHWRPVGDAVRAKLECEDPWARLVAWTCLCVSPDRSLTVPALTKALHSLGRALPRDSSLDGHLYLRPTGSAVRQHWVLGSARRILVVNPEPEAVQALNALIGGAEGLGSGTVGELRNLFKQVGLELNAPTDKSWAMSMSSLMHPREKRKSEHLYLIEVVDDPSLTNDLEDSNSDGLSLELGALLAATSFWEMWDWDDVHIPAPAQATVQRRMVIRAVGRAAGIDHARLVRQARAMKKRIVAEEESDDVALFSLPDIDAEANFEQPLIGAEHMSDLEELILGESHFFALNAAQLLYGLREQAKYADAIKRLLTGGRGESLRLSNALASQLPSEAYQQFLLDRLCQGDSTSGCRHLYPHLTPPFGVRHLEAVRKGLGGQSARAAEAAAALAAKLSVDVELASELRVFFDQWKTKEEPYPKESGAIPDSPREELAKILVKTFAQDHSFLLDLLTDVRSDVRNVAREPVLTAAFISQPLRTRLLDEVQSGNLGPDVLRAAVSQGSYLGEEAEQVARLLQSSTARVRYAALPILNVKFLPADFVRTESVRLLSDEEMEIREGASRSLHSLSSSDADRF